MVGDIFIEVGNAQEKLEDAALTREIACLGGFGKGVERNVRVSQKPIESGAIDRFSAMANFESEIGARERLIEEVIEAKSLGGQNGGNLLVTPIDAAASGSSRRHTTPLGRAWSERRGRQKGIINFCARAERAS
jgi:hypothetical protein